MNNNEEFQNSLLKLNMIINNINNILTNINKEGKKNRKYT